MSQRLHPDEALPQEPIIPPPPDQSSTQTLPHSHLHNHLVSERPKTVTELYDQFAKFSKSEIQHSRKLEQLRKLANLDEALRAHNTDNQHNYPKPVHSIGSEGVRPSEN
jgi:hypothetical protein